MGCVRLLALAWFVCSSCVCEFKEELKEEFVSERKEMRELKDKARHLQVMLKHKKMSGDQWVRV